MQRRLMKARVFLFRHSALWLVPVWFGTGVAPAAPTPMAAAPPAGAKATPPEPEIPQSAFILPRDRQEGRDPFFPNSNRPYEGAATRITQPAQPVIRLRLQGLKPPPAEHPLALIEGKTFAKGEERELTAFGRRLTVRCLDITAESVVVEVDGVRQELRLPRSGL